MPFYHYLNRPGFVNDPGASNTIAPSDDRKNRIKLKDFPNTQYLTLVPESDSYRAVPFIGFKSGEVVLGFYLDSGAPNYTFMEGRSNLEWYRTSEHWGQFLASLDSYTDFDGLYSLSNDVAAARLNVHSAGKELLLVIDMRDGENISYLDSINEGSCDEEYLDLFSVKYNSVTIPEANQIQEKVDQLDSMIGSTASSYISR